MHAEKLLQQRFPKQRIKVFDRYFYLPVPVGQVQTLFTPNTSILSHQYSWGAIGKEHELFATVREFDLTTKKMIQHYKKSTGLTEVQIREVLLPPQDVWLSPQEAKKLGLCDDIKDLK